MDTISIKSPFRDKDDAEISVSQGATTGVEQIALLSILTLRTGSASVQVYISADKLEELESLLALHRSQLNKRIDVRAQERAEVMA